jgi:osmotically-inducible protein OsmY
MKKNLKAEITAVSWDDKKGLYTAHWQVYNNNGDVVMSGEMDFDYERDDAMSYELSIYNEIMEIIKSEGKVKN